MKHFFKKTIIFVLVLCTIVGISSVSVADEIGNQNSYYEYLMKKQENAILADICLENALNELAQSQ